MLYSTFTLYNNKFYVIISGCDDKILTHNERGALEMWSEIKGFNTVTQDFLF